MQKIIHVKGHPERFLYLAFNYRIDDELYYTLKNQENEDLGSIILSKKGFYGSFEIESLLQGHGEYEMGEI